MSTAQAFRGQKDHAVRPQTVQDDEDHAVQLHINQEDHAVTECPQLQALHFKKIVLSSSKHFKKKIMQSLNVCSYVNLKGKDVLNGKDVHKGNAECSWPLACF